MVEYIELYETVSLFGLPCISMETVAVASWDRLPLGMEQVEFDSWQCQINPMFIEPTITWVPSGFSGYIIMA